MKNLVMMVGLPRSGKSTRAQELGHPIVCPDAIREALKGSRDMHWPLEPMVWAIAKVMVRALFNAGHDTVTLDACNNTQRRRLEWKDAGWARSYHIMETSKEVCRQRAASTEGTSALLPVIDRMAKQHEPVKDFECDETGDTTEG